MVSGIKTGRVGATEIIYPMRDKKKQKGPRVEAFACGGGIIDTGDRADIVAQFRDVWHMGCRMRGDNLLYKYMLSWSRNELPPDDPRSIEKALAMGERIMEQMCPDRQWILVIQKDGKSGLIHAHGISNALHNDGKPAHGRETDYRALRRLADKTLEEYGIELDLGENHKKKEAKLKRRRDYMRKRHGYSWTEFLESRIEKAISETTKKSDFESKLKEYGVSVVTKSRGGWTYRLEDSPDGEYIGKSAKYDQLMGDYSTKSINAQIDANYQQMKEAEKASGYSWLDDLKGKIKLAILDTTRKADFEDSLRHRGVSVVDKTRKGWTYRLDAAKDKKYNGRIASYEALGAEFTNHIINLMIDMNYSSGGMQMFDLEAEMWMALRDERAKADEEAFEKELAKYLAEKEAEEKAGKGEADRGTEAEKRLGTDGSGYGSGTESQMEY